MHGTNVTGQFQPQTLGLGTHWFSKRPFQTKVNFSVNFFLFWHFWKKIESLIAISTVLNYNKTLKSLNVNRPVPQYQFSNWMDEIAQHFTIMLKANSSLRELHMQKYEFRDYGAQWFSEKLIDNNFLVHLDLSW